MINIVIAIISLIGSLAMGWITPFIFSVAEKVGKVATGCFIGAVVIFSIAMVVMLYKVIDCLCETIFARLNFKLAMIIEIIGAVAVFAGVFYVGYNIIYGSSLAATILDYLSTTSVIIILATVLIAPVYIRVQMDIEEYETAFNVFHILIVVIGIAITVPAYNYSKTNSYPKYSAEDFSEHICYNCVEPADGGSVVFKKKGEPTYLCKTHFEAAKTSDPREDEFGHDKYNALFAAKNEVEERLKSPSTAKFCPDDEASVKKLGNTWIVKGWVDAQNSFNATIRNRFSVEITYTGEDTYTVAYCIIE